MTAKKIITWLESVIERNLELLDTPFEFPGGVSREQHIEKAYALLEKYKAKVVVEAK